MFADRMNKFELEREIAKQTTRLNSAVKILDKIYGTRDYSDAVAEYFHMGKVGFRHDTKRQNQIIDGAVRRGTEATKQCEIRDNAKGIIVYCQNMIDYIVKNAPEGETENYTKQMIFDQQKKTALASAPEIEWTKSKGNYGTLYAYGDYQVEKVDCDFVSIRKHGENVTHCKTVKEAKATVSLCVERANRTA